LTQVVGGCGVSPAHVFQVERVNRDDDSVAVDHLQ